MKFFFNDKDPKSVNDKILDAIGGRELGKIVQFEVGKNDLVVTISKMGTSTLTFNHSEKNGGRQFELANEKIAFTHRAFKQDVIDKLCQVIEKCGGKVVEK
jgi:hypothetical protein